MTHNHLHVLKNKKGNTLIIVLVALGLTALIAMNMADLFSGAFKTQRSITQSVAVEQTVDLAQLALSKKASCEQALLKDAAGKPITSRKVSDLKKGISLSEFLIPQSSGGTSVLFKSLSSSDCKKPENTGACNNAIVSSITISPKKDAAGNDISAISNTYHLGELVLTFQKTGSVTGAQTVSRSIPIGLNIDPVTNTITSCQSAGDVTQDAADSKPKRRCAPSIYSNKPWTKERIYCSTQGGGVAVLYYAGDNLKGLSNTLVYTSPHGKDPMTMMYDASNGNFVKYQWAEHDDGQSCINKNLKDIVADAENQCAD